MMLDVFTRGRGRGAHFDCDRFTVLNVESGALVDVEEEFVCCGLESKASVGWVLEALGAFS